MLDAYVFGSNEIDQLGLKDYKFSRSKIPKLLPFDFEPRIKVYKVCCGGQFTLVLTTEGKILSWGSNDENALGRVGEEKYPAMVILPYPMTNIAAGSCHAIAYNTDLNLIYRWGQYKGNGGNIGRTMELPEQMDVKREFGGRKIEKVVCGGDHTLVLANKSVFAWGNPESGQTGYNPNRLPEDIMKVNKFETKNVLDIFSGNSHSFLITTRHATKRRIVKGWGLNSYGQLGLGNRQDYWIPQELTFFTERDLNVIQATGGLSFSVFLTDNREVYVCGSNEISQLGLSEEAVHQVEQEWTRKENEQREAENRKENNNKEGNVESQVKEIQNAPVNEEKENPVENPKSESENNVNPPQTEPRQTGMIVEVQENAPIQEPPKQIPQATVKGVQNYCVLNPLRLDYLSQEGKRIDLIYSSDFYSYAVDLSSNQAYSWGMGDHLVLANKSDESENVPYPIPKDFFYNLRLNHFGLGTMHVVCALSDPNSDLPNPYLEYDKHHYKEELKKIVAANRTKPGKRKAELLPEEYKEEALVSTGRTKRKVTEKKEEPVVKKTAEKKRETKKKSKPKTESAQRGRSKTKLAKESTKTEKKEKTKLKPKEKEEVKTKSKSKSKAPTKSSSKAKSTTKRK